MNFELFDASIFSFSSGQLLALLPFGVLCLGMVLSTIAAGYKSNKKIHRVLMMGVLGAFAFLVARSLGQGEVSIFGTSLLIDDNLRWIGLGLAILGMVSSLFVAEKESGEWSTLILISIFALTMLVGARDWVMFFVCLETLAIPSYIMASMKQKQDGGFEAGIKYLLMGAFSSALLLMGLALVFGAAGSFDYETINIVIMNGLPTPLIQAGALLILVSLCFKVALAPLHMWAPDVYQSAHSGLAAFMATAGKLGVFSAALIAFTKCGFLNLESFQWAVLSMAIISIVVGNLMALIQKNIRRTLAYSSVASAGYAAMIWRLSDASQPALFVYLFTYGLSFIVAFAAIEILTHALRKPSSTHLDFSDLEQINPSHAKLGVFALSLSIFSMAGIPPLPGFLGKYLIIVDLWEVSKGVEITWILIGSLMSLGYYLKILVPLYLDNPHKLATLPGNNTCSLWPKVAAVVGLVILFVGLGVLGQI